MMFLNVLMAAAAVSAASLSQIAPAVDSNQELLLARQQDALQVNLTSAVTTDGERGPAAVYSARPQVVVPKTRNVQVGDRPYFLVQNMTDGPLKQRLQACEEFPLRPTQFAISHRGAPLQYPEHTMQGIQTAARHGAGVIECDVTFTKDRELVCRHSQCDLHTTTNILAIPELAAKCNTTFTPAVNGKPASANCCTADITLAEFKSLCGKQDGFNKSATNPVDALNGAPTWRTELYDTCGQLMSHKEYIAAVDALGVSFTPEAKEPLVPMPFQGQFTQEQYLDKIVDEYKQANVHPSRVWYQSFRLSDIEYLVRAHPDFARQAVFLDERTDTPEGLQNATKLETMQDLVRRGVKILAPSFPWLLAVDNSTKEIVPSEYARNAEAAGLKIITWSLERSGPLAKVASAQDYYYSTLFDVIKYDGQLYDVIDALAQKVKVIGMFSDWPATITYYANCFGLLGGYQDPDRN